ncbi:MAG: sulfurtransferase [Pandoraea sp.]|uniref:sulfurtransferase n=1 Tax=Pandoraea sp. TaxID=1883445 RepID=UPI0011FF26AD|nr:sulfurtransferase [Pandoraea sp.]TAM17558.1 MAG: sulfurtransferase [Pandoraea sp.]
MRFDTLISSEQLTALLADDSADVLVCDCSFDLTAPAAGFASYHEAHVPGAIYLHLETELSGPKTGQNGRHPLPSQDAFADAMSRAGASDGTQIVCYDSTGGMYAARLWWLARWAGHRDVAVLDGGLPGWRAAGNPVESGDTATRAPGGFTVREPLVETVDFDSVRANIDDGSRVVLDARAPDRFRGENETLDAVGGHIPKARNRFFRDNLDASGRFKPADVLRQEIGEIAGTTDGAALIGQCGSGVTACHNLLAMEIAGIRGAALYPGSWSEWSSRNGAPVATGAQA